MSQLCEKVEGVPGVIYYDEKAVVIITHFVLLNWTNL